MDYMGDNAESYLHQGPNLSRGYIYPSLTASLRKAGARRIFEIGCGTGDIAALLLKDSFSVLATDPSVDALRQAKEKYPGLSVEAASAYDPLSERFGKWDAVIALEVIEHLYRPKDLVHAAYELLHPNGVLIMSAPFHGYWKNLALSLAGQWDDHFMPLRDHGHIKFWSETTIGSLLTKGGFKIVRIDRVGRIPALAKSMVVTAIRAEPVANEIGVRPSS